MNTFISKPHFHHLPTYYFSAAILLLSSLVVRAQDTGFDSSSTPNTIHTLGVVLLAVIALLGYLVLYLLFKHCFQPWANRRAERRARVGLDPAILQTLPVLSYSSMAGLKPSIAGSEPDKSTVECAVCLGLYEGDEKVRLLPKCGHFFHVDCVDPWLKGHSTCPLCRADLETQPDELTEVGSDFVVVELEGGEEEVNVGVNDVEGEARGRVEGGQSEKIWRWNSTGHVAKKDWMEVGEKSTELTKDVWTKELNRSRSCNMIRLELR